MILGVGSDIVDIARMEAALTRQQVAFMKRVLSPAEIATAASYPLHRQSEFVAGRFAAKEAIAKAIGCGLGRLVMSTVTISVTQYGLSVMAVPPSELADCLQENTVHVSISHAQNVAMAFAVYEQGAVLR